MTYRHHFEVPLSRHNSVMVRRIGMKLWRRTSSRLNLATDKSLI